MQLAIECPTYLLKSIQPLADFDWILTHLVLQDEEYAEFYSKSTRRRVLDNSVNELLSPCSLEDMKKAIGILGGVDTIVPPDFLGDSVSTEKSLREALEVFEEEELLPVIQGSDWSEVFECADYIESLGISEIAVPYDITCSRMDPLQTMANSRLRVVYKLGRDYGFGIHLLGVTTLQELVEQSRLGYASSVDTGSPVLHGLNGLKYGKCELFSKSTPTMDLMPTTPIFDLEDTYYNIACLRKVISD